MAGIVNEKIKVVHLQLLSIFSGAQKVSYDEIKNLDTVRYFLIVKEPGPLTTKLHSYAEDVRYLNDLQRRINVTSDIKSIFQLVKILKDIRPDILHTHSSKTGVIGRIAGYFLGIPVVHTVHGFSFPAAESRLAKNLYWLLEYLTLRLSTKVIVLNNTDRKITQQLGVKANNIVLLPNGVEVRPTEKSDMLEETTNMYVSSCNLVFLGRLEKQKNPFELMHALKILNENYKVKVKLHIYGTGSLETDLKNWVESNQLTGNIIFHGWCDDPINVLMKSEVCINTSIWEGMSLSILEAMSAGCHVLVSDIKANQHFVSGGKTGTTYKQGSPSDLASQINYLINNPTVRKTLASEGRKFVTKNFSLAVRNKSILKLYKEIVS